MDCVVHNHEHSRAGREKRPSIYTEVHYDDTTLAITMNRPPRIQDNWHLPLQGNVILLFDQMMSPNKYHDLNISQLRHTSKSLHLRRPASHGDSKLQIHPSWKSPQQNLSCKAGMEGIRSEGMLSESYFDPSLSTGTALLKKLVTAIGTVKLTTRVDEAIWLP